jgi:hypothetical protein
MENQAARASSGLPELVVADCSASDLFQQWQSPAGRSVGE